jgi:hypothetical protein
MLCIQAAHLQGGEMGEFLEQIEPDLWTDEELLTLVGEIHLELTGRYKSRAAETNVPLTWDEAGYIIQALKEYEESHSFGPDTKDIIPQLLHKINHYVFEGRGG